MTAESGSFSSLGQRRRRIVKAANDHATGTRGEPSASIPASGDKLTKRGSLGLRPPVVSLGFVGDLMLGRGVADLVGTKPTEAFWGDVGPLLSRADSVIGNLESPITDRPDRWTRCWKAFRFQANPRVIDILKAGNIGGVCVANNHILDCEVSGLGETLRHLDHAEISHVGAGEDLREAMRPALFDAGGTTVGMVGLTNTMPEFAAGPARPGTHYAKIRDDSAILETLGRLQWDMRVNGAAATILTVHWGPNLRPWPPARYRRFARAVIDLGFDVVHGHSAHILQGVEFWGSGLILYDTGDCLDDYWVFPGIRTDRSAVFFVDVGPGGVQSLNIVPIILTPAKVRRAYGREAKATIGKLLRRSPSLAKRADLTATLDLRREGNSKSIFGNPASNGIRINAEDQVPPQGAVS